MLSPRRGTTILPIGAPRAAPARSFRAYVEIAAASAAGLAVGITRLAIAPYDPVVLGNERVLLVARVERREGIVPTPDDEVQTSSATPTKRRLL